MKTTIGLLGMLLCLYSCKEKKDKAASINDVEEIAIPAGMEGLDKWFTAWELTSTRKFALLPVPAPAILLYDDKHVYTISAVSAPDSAVPYTGPAFFDQQLPWKRGPHHDTLTIPDGKKVPVGLMSFAASDSSGHPFFVMAAPGFWKAAGVESKELGLDNLLTAVFLHEFSHTRQQAGMGAMVDSIEKTHSFKDPELSDDIVQHTFQNDSNYVRSFRAEVSKFYEAAFAGDKEKTKQLTREALLLLKKRQSTYFIKEHAVLKPLDDIFLTMEGLGQFAGFYWLQDPSGANIPFEKAVEGMRRKRNQWSQEEGLAMFLVLDKLTKPNWSNDLFGEHPKNIIALLEAAVQ
ncbi:hypothetical protein D3H65_32645 [Paraflavitalea soli]|uniref:Uncharacterized protein n=1 Tax=Paraflavitalea soli TaxID=2315862 RepID=A0A3B7MWH2_9BACT|nr:hypothetical protein [Paraflavitalea soli]AXY78448.1 hypothetical protein D3H65_32645 [Paraflavitalea soli]